MDIPSYFDPLPLFLFFSSIISCCSLAGIVDGYEEHIFSPSLYFYSISWKLCETVTWDIFPFIG